MGRLQGWQKTFANKTATGKYWKDIHGDIDKEWFLMRSDAVTICQEAQLDMIHSIMQKTNDPQVLEVLRSERTRILAEDNSALGMMQE